MIEMDVIEVLKILEVALIAGLKFLFSPFEAERQGFTYMESLIIITVGGLIGIFVFTYLRDVLIFGWKNLVLKVRHLFGKQELDIEHTVFSWKSRLIIKVKWRFGILGLAMLTPTIMSIPIGTFIVNHFYRDKKRTLFYLTIAIIVWAFILNTVAYTLKLSKYLSA